MNTHPVFRSFLTRIFYAAIWLFASMVQTVLIVFTTEASLGYALLHSLVFNLFFAAGIIFLWYPVYYIDWKNKEWYSTLIFHILMMALLLLIGLGCGYLTMSILLNINAFSDFSGLSFGWEIGEGIIFYILATLIYYQFLYIDKLNEKAENEILLNKLLRDGELNLLKSQINPHFLFNSLNSLNSLIVKNPEQAQEMLIALSDYLRYTVISTKEYHFKLKTEIANIERYLSIEQLRFGKKLTYKFNIDNDCLQENIPSMLLQPLFENAIKHGVCESIETVNILTSIRKIEDTLEIEICNNFAPDKPNAAKGSGTGLKNIRERLHLSYGNQASLSVKVENSTFKVRLKIPIQ